MVIEFRTVFMGSRQRYQKSSQCYLSTLCCRAVTVTGRGHHTDLLILNQSPHSDYVRRCYTKVYLNVLLREVITAGSLILNLLEK